MVKNELKTTNDKKLVVEKKILTFLIGEITSQVYGVVGLTSVKTIKNQLVILKKENYVDGIIIDKLINGKYDLEIHLIVAYGIKTTEVVNEVSKRIHYEINKRYGKILNKVNVYVEDLLDL